MFKIIKKLKNKIADMGMFLKITILFEMVMILTILFIAFFITSKFTEMMKEKEIALGSNRLEKVADYVQQKYERIYSLSNYIHSSNISEIITRVSKDPNEVSSIENIELINVFFRGVRSADPDFSDFVLVSTNNMVYSASAMGYSAVKPSFRFFDTTMTKQLLSSNKDMLIISQNPTLYTIRERERVITFIGKIFNASDFPKRNLVGLYIFNLPLEKIQKILEPEADITKGELILVNDSGQILFDSEPGKIGHNLGDYETTFNRNWYRTKKKVGTSGITVVYQLPERMLLKELNQLKGKIFIVLSIAIGITLLWSFIIYQVFEKKSKQLIASMKKVQEGDFRFRIPIKSHDEIGLIGKSFNEMCDRLSEYISQVYIEEIRRRNAELNALQSQIDPHFLYNTLESIKTKALEENDEITAKMISILGNLFRWNGRTKDKIVILEDEMEYIHDYLELQRYRFNQPLDVDIEISEYLLDYGIPKLTLQPIVENVIKHGLSYNGRPGIIGIIARIKHEKQLEITIYDNGKGMHVEKLNEVKEMLEREINQDDFTGIGIHNVHQRIQLLFGKEYGLRINSVEGLGTAVKVILPAMLKEEMENRV